MIKKEGRKHVLYTKDGTRKLGTHHSREAAVHQEIVIHLAKQQRKREHK